MIRYFLLFFICTLTSFKTADEQPNISYEVTLLTGEFWYQNVGKGAWTKVIKPGTVSLFNPLDKIKLGANAQLSLKNGNNWSIINKIGIWSLQQLATTHDRSQNVTGPYIEFLLQNIMHKHRSIDEYAEGYMRKKGLVSRGAGCVAPLMISPEYEASLSADTTIFTWKSQSDAEGYTLSFYRDWQEDSKPFLTKELRDTTLLVDLNAALIERGTEYFWCVYPKGKPNCARYNFKLVETEEFKKFEEKLKILSADLTYGAGLNFFLKAALYEQNNFFGEAAREYQKAINQDKENPLFAESYKLFLARNGRLSEAKKIFF